MSSFFYLLSHDIETVRERCKTYHTKRLIHVGIQGLNIIFLFYVSYLARICSVNATNTVDCTFRLVFKTTSITASIVEQSKNYCDYHSPSKRQ